MAQAVRVARLAAPDNGTLQEKVIRNFAAHIAECGLAGSPPALLRPLYLSVPQLTGVCDPFAVAKRQANQRAAALLPRLRRMLKASAEPLRMALHIAIIGNYIDAGTGIDYDWERALDTETDSPWSPANYAAFCQELAQADTVLIIGDNCGEIVLDMLLVEQLQNMGLDVTYAVRERPVLNDATQKDAQACGMSELCRVVSCGADTPGVLAERLAPDFRNRLMAADVVLAKGQGNYEGMHGALRPIWFAFKAKCAVVATTLAVAQGTSMFLSQQPQPGVPLACMKKFKELF